MPLILLYMLMLMLAAWPREVRSAAGVASFRLLSSVGIRAGMAVFPGTPKKQSNVIRARCIIATGIDSHGRETRIYPLEACPREGFRWRPVVYEHMLFHWVWGIHDDSDPFNLWVMGDHFCHVSRDPELVQVKLTREVTRIDYQTGRESMKSHLLGQVECRS